MTLSEFRCQPQCEKPQLVLSRGVLLLIRSTGTYDAFLYHMGGFFAEVWYSRAGRSVAMIHGFEDSSMLEPYLDMISIAALTIDS